MQRQLRAACGAGHRLEHGAPCLGHSIAPSAVGDAVRRAPLPLVALPSILLKAGNLTRADVTVHQCGTATAPLLLGGSLAHVEELVLDCVELHAIVPAHVTWRNVYVAATHLNLRFEAVASFGEAIPAFCFRFNKLQVCYPQPSLYLFMAATVSPAPNLLCCTSRVQRFLNWRLSWQGGSQSGLEPAHGWRCHPTSARNQRHVLPTGTAAS